MGVKFEDKSAEFLKRVEKAADKGVAVAAEYLAQNIQSSMPGAGAGVEVGTGGDSGVRANYIASNPGSTPGVRTNRLKGSITSQKTDKKMQRAVGTNVNYAMALERGTSKMPARPFMTPGVRASKKGMIARFKKAMKAVTS